MPSKLRDFPCNSPEPSSAYFCIGVSVFQVCYYRGMYYMHNRGHVSNSPSCVGYRLVLSRGVHPGMQTSSHYFTNHLSVRRVLLLCRFGYDFSLILRCILMLLLILLMGLAYLGCATILGHLGTLNISTNAYFYTYCK